LTEASHPVVIPFPHSVAGLSVTDLHAGLLAVAYQAHEYANKEKHFGHVKAEKFSHCIESIAGIDLARTPQKQAAGPFDSERFDAVEKRALRAAWFYFDKRPSGGYTFVKGRKFDELVATTRSALGELNQKVDALIELMLAMDKEAVEVFATVHAAWNNLLLDKQTVTDERIVTEARENWHRDKLKIAREKFFCAIRQIREAGVCPEGKGKKVIGKSF
jgi:hypothetical protein